MVTVRDTIEMSKTEIEMLKAAALQKNTSHPSYDVYDKTPVKRPRSLTTLKLEVVAERARKMKKIKEAIQSSTYCVPSNEVARSLLKHYNEDDIKE